MQGTDHFSVSHQSKPAIMPEGLFTPDQIHLNNIERDRLVAAMVRIRPKTRLVLDLVDNFEQIQKLSRNESEADGTECWYRYFLREDVNRVNEPEFYMGMVRWEFSQLVKAGRQFPAETWLNGGGSGFCISSNGLILTNYHLVTGEVAFHSRRAGVLNQEVLCRALQVDVATNRKDGVWNWQPAEKVYLVSNPPESRAIQTIEGGQALLREDVSLLRIEPAPTSCLSISKRTVHLGERLWVAGFPLRTSRSIEAKKMYNYEDADGTLRLSAGNVTAAEQQGYFNTDADGSMGNSGSAAIDYNGRVVGIFSRATGNGPRNAFEYGHTERIFVASALIATSLELGA
jgi:S1-C subfamily serine protease